MPISRKETIVLVLLKGISKEKSVSSVYPPFALMLVGGALKKAGYEVKIYHIYASEIDKYVNEIVAKKPLFVGFSVLTGLPINLSISMSKKIKRCNSKIPIVWGGIHPSLIPEQCLAEDYIDFVIIGEGEETVVNLADYLKNGYSFEKINGLGYKKDGKVIINKPREFIKNLDKYEIDWSLVDINKYIYRIWDGTRIISYITSRGCPHNCAFCYNLNFNKRRWRAFSKEIVIERIRKLIKEHDIEGITFDDDNFFTDKKRALDILNNIMVPTYFLNIRIDYLNEEFLSKLNKTGCKWIFFGWESGNDRILKLMNKQFTTQEILNTVRLLANKYPHISIRCSGIIGFPTETWEEVKNTIDFALKLCYIHPNISIESTTYGPYPGTEFYGLAIREGFNPPRNLEEWGYFDLDLSNRGEAIKRKKPDWLPWMTPKQFKDFGKINGYAHLLDKNYLQGVHPWYFRAIKKIFYYFAYYRLKTKIFYFPFELFLFDKTVKIAEMIRDIKKK